MRQRWPIGCVALLLASCSLDDAKPARGAEGTEGRSGRGRPGPRTPRADEHCVALPPAVIAAEPPSVQCEEDAATDAPRAPGPVGFGYPMEHGGLPDGVAYLTLDDGPSEWTADFLDTLAEQEVPATFFVRGRSWGRKGEHLDGSYRNAGGESIAYEDVLKRMLDEGHVIGNSSLDHLDLGELTPDDVAYQLDENERVINMALLRAGAMPRPLSLVRPPFGSPWFYGPNELADREWHQQEVGAELELRGVTVLWNVDSTDSREWAQGETASHGPIELGGERSDLGYDEKVARIEQAVLEAEPVEAGAGVIVLLNDLHNTTRDALSRIIDGLRGHGYTFATLEDLVQARFGRASWGVSPGPDLHDPCTADADRGCLRFDKTDLEVCGRFFRAYEAAGGADVLGAPLANAVAEAAGGDARSWSQRFENGVLELRAEVDPPCNVIVRETPAPQ